MSLPCWGTMRKSPSALYMALFSILWLQVYTWTARPFLLLLSPAPVIGLSIACFHCSISHLLPSSVHLPSQPWTQREYQKVSISFGLGLVAGPPICWSNKAEDKAGKVRAWQMAASDITKLVGLFPLEQWRLFRSLALHKGHIYKLVGCFDPLEAILGNVSPRRQSHYQNHIDNLNPPSLNLQMLSCSLCPHCPLRAV